MSCARLKILFSYDSCDNLGVGVSVRVKVKVHFFFASCARLLVSLREPLPTQPSSSTYFARCER